MFAKIFCKEWKDNRSIFSIALLFILALIVLNSSHQKELTLNFFGMFLIVFLPASGLIIGSGGFYSEFKDNAWIYLFSRPIGKEKIWAFKFISLLSILFAIVVIFSLVKQFLPGFGEIMKEFNVPRELRGLVSLSTYIVLPFLIFTISFSLSILYEKQFVVAFIAALLAVGLAFLLQQYYVFLWTTYLYDGELKGFQVLIALSFIAASVLTLIKSDFSQSGRKAFLFAKYLVLFLILSFFITTVWIAKWNLFSGKTSILTYDSTTREYRGDFYFGTYAKGMSTMYSSAHDKVIKIGGMARGFSPNASFGGNKIAYLIEEKSSGGWHDNLYIMNLDGSSNRVLIDSSKSGSQFNYSSFYSSCLLSPDGTRLAFVTVPTSRNIVKSSPTLWWMNTDGTGLRSLALDFSKLQSLDLFAWPADADRLIFAVKEHSSAYRLMEVEFEKGTQKTLLENIAGPYFVRVSPEQSALALWQRDTIDDKAILVYLDLKTFNKKVILKNDFPIPGGAPKWSKNGDKIAFSIKNQIFIYSIKEDKIIWKTSWRNKSGYHPYFDWLLHDQKFILNEMLEDRGNDLRVFGEDFSEEKRIKIPDSIGMPADVWGLENKALIYDSERERLWRVDLASQKWKKVY